MSEKKINKDERVISSMSSCKSCKGDNVSLVYLAKILISRRSWLFSTFIVVFSVALVVAWFKRPQQTIDDGRVAFTTLLSVGYKSPTVFIEPLRSIQTQLVSAFIPSASQNYSFNAKVEIEKRRNVSEDGNNIVKLITIADKDQRLKVIDYHQEILKPLLERHSRLDNELKQQILSLKINDSGLQPLGSSVAAIAQPLPVSSGGRRSNSLIIIVFGFFLAGLLAVIVSFVREFSEQVYKSLDDDSK